MTAPFLCLQGQLLSNDAVSLQKQQYNETVFPVFPEVRAVSPLIHSVLIAQRARNVQEGLVL